MNHAPFTMINTPQKTAADLYVGMVNAARDLEKTAIPAILKHFAKREIETSAELAFGHKHHVTKFTQDMNKLDSARMAISRRKLELFCMISALNLYEGREFQEDFAAKAMEMEFLKQVTSHEDNWLELNNAQILDFKEQTGYERNSWRKNLILGYLEGLKTKSSRDPATLVATKRFLARQGLATEAGVHVSPALLEACAAEFIHASQWLVNYLERKAN